MKVIVAGSRTITDPDLVEKAISDSGFQITELVCGTAKGVDSLGLSWAIKRNIRITSFPANWNEHGRAAGPIRNAEMARYAEALILVWDGKSSGSANMKTQAEGRGLRVFEVIVDN